MDNRVYWIWLQHAFGAGSPMPWRLHQRIPGGVEGFYRGGPRLWNSLPEINDQAAAALYSFSLAEAQAQLEYAIKVGWRVITPGSPKYPVALQNIYDPPAVLYGKGTLPDVDQVINRGAAHVHAHLPFLDGYKLFLFLCQRIIDFHSVSLSVPPSLYG